ncbi:MAG: hypothetical protein JNM60_09105, partial [Candidatus Competibacteraceae bacterium]|nr:hypothetical protein [Candidatus Competibacteraceae bacterium]
MRELLPDIRQKKAEGWTHAELAAALAETFGFKVSRQTLAVRISRLTRAAARAAGGDAAAGQRLPQKSQRVDPEEKMIEPARCAGRSIRLRPHRRRAGGGS